MTSSTSAHSLRPVLSWLQAASFALGAIVGWACFVLPTDQFLPQAGPMGYVAGIVISAGLLMILACNYGVMLKCFPKAGGAFFYTAKLFSRRTAFFCGWVLIACYLSLVANNLSALAVIFRYLLPGLMQHIYLYSLAGWPVFLEEVIFTSLCACVFAWCCLRGIGLSGTVQNMLVFALTFGISFFFIAALILGDASFENLKPLFAENKGAVASTLYVMALSPFIFIGFDAVAQTAEEFNFKPSKALNIMMLSIAAGGILYIMGLLTCAVPWSYEELLQWCQADKAQGGSAFGYAFVAERLLGKLGAAAILIPVLGAVLSGVNGFFIVCTRLIFSMARSGFLPESLGKVSSKTGVPSNAAWLVLFVALCSAFCGRQVIPWVVDTSSIGACIGYLMTCLCARKVLKDQATIANRFSNIVGILYAVCCLLLMTVPGSPARLNAQAFVILLVWLIIGALIYQRQRRRNFGEYN